MRLIVVRYVKAGYSLCDNGKVIGMMCCICKRHHTSSKCNPFYCLGCDPVADLGL